MEYIVSLLKIVSRRRFLSVKPAVVTDYTVAKKKSKTTGNRDRVENPTTGRKYYETSKPIAYSLQPCSTFTASKFAMQASGSETVLIHV